MINKNTIESSENISAFNNIFDILKWKWKLCILIYYLKMLNLLKPIRAIRFSVKYEALIYNYYWSHIIIQSWITIRSRTAIWSRIIIRGQIIRSRITNSISNYY